MKVPQSVREVGFQHRRQYKYVELPALQEKLRTARKAYLSYNKWYDANPCVHTDKTTEVLIEVQEGLRNAWLAYYGTEAEKELSVMYQQDIFQVEGWRTAMICINYDAPDHRMYRSVSLITDTTRMWATEDPCADYNAALKAAQALDIDEIIFHDTCQMFMLHSRGRFAFNLNDQLVRVERE